jgi:hypothetical protein
LTRIFQCDGATIANFEVGEQSPSPNYVGTSLLVRRDWYSFPSKREKREKRGEKRGRTSFPDSQDATGSACFDMANISIAAGSPGGNGDIRLNYSPPFVCDDTLHFHPPKKAAKGGYADLRG